MFLQVQITPPFSQDRTFPEPISVLLVAKHVKECFKPNQRVGSRGTRFETQFEVEKALFYALFKDFRTFQQDNRPNLTNPMVLCEEKGLSNQKKNLVVIIYGFLVGF